MSTIKKQIFLALKAHLKKQVPELNWIDKDMGQVRQLDQFVIPMPAVLIGFGQTTYETLGKNQQQGSGQIVFTILYENYSEAFEGSADEELALRFFDFNQKIHDALQGFDGEGFTALMRTQDEEDAEHNTFIATTFRYGTSFIDRKVDTSILIDRQVQAKPVYKKPLSKPASNITSEFVT